MNAVLGIDVSKDHLDVCLLSETGRRSGQFSNTAKGCQQLEGWLKPQRVHACLEATGTYGDEVAVALHQTGHTVSVVNPARIKAYSHSRMQRNKTDQLDAVLIAEYCRTQQPPAWTPPPPERLDLRAMVRRLTTLKTAKQQENNRLKSGEQSAVVIACIQQHIAFLQQQMTQLEQAILAHIQAHPALQADFDLLVSVKGIGRQTALVLLAEIPDIQRFSSAKQLIAYAGLNPTQKSSGRHTSAFTPISKKGNALLRAGLYMAGLCAKKHNPPVRAMSERLQARGKTQKEITVAAMAKLLRIVFAILRSRQLFDPQFDTFTHLSLDF